MKYPRAEGDNIIKDMKIFFRPEKELSYTAIKYLNQTRRLLKDFMNKPKKSDTWEKNYQ